MERFQLVLLNSTLLKQPIVAVAILITLAMMEVAFVCLEQGFDLSHVKGNVAPPIRISLFGSFCILNLLELSGYEIQA